jgi:hypothetical protein
MPLYLTPVVDSLKLRVPGVMNCRIVGTPALEWNELERWLVEDKPQQV